MYLGSTWVLKGGNGFGRLGDALFAKVWDGQMLLEGDLMGWQKNCKCICS